MRSVPWVCSMARGWWVWWMLTYWGCGGCVADPFPSLKSFWSSLTYFLFVNLLVCGCHCCVTCRGKNYRIWSQTLHCNSQSYIVSVGGFLLSKVWHFKFGMLPNCSHLLTDFRTVFVFALGPFLLMLVICFDFNGNFYGKMAKIHFLAIKSSRSVLQPSSYHCWATFL